MEEKDTVIDNLRNKEGRAEERIKSFEEQTVELKQFVQEKDHKMIEMGKREASLES